jgi:endoglucanase
MRLLALWASLALLFLPGCAGAAERRAVPADPQARAELAEWWTQYKRTFIEESGRVIRPRNQNDTVSEGQAYGMLFAVILDDRDAFDRIHAWTKKELSREALQADHLLGWHWRAGKVIDWNSASDADLDYIFALLLAHKRWGDEAFREEALLVAADVLEHETRRRNDLLLLIPGVWEDKDRDGLMINPSYFSPATYRLLTEATGEPKWDELTASTYRIWESVGEYMGKRKGAGLIPDWCRYTTEGEIRSINTRAPTYGWDALRYPLRAGFDALMWNEEPARRLLRNGPVRHFQNWFAEGHDRAAAVYDYDGRLWDDIPSLAMTSMALFAFQVTGETPPAPLTASFGEQRSDPFFTRDYYGQSLSFFPLAYKAGVLTPELIRLKVREE